MAPTRLFQLPLQSADWSDWVNADASWTRSSLAATGSGRLGTSAVIPGSEIDDLLDGTAGRDLLIGRAGHDTLDAGVGNDILIGGRDGDTYIVSAATSDSDVMIDLGNAPTGTGPYTTGHDILQINGYVSTSDAIHDLGIAISGDDLILSYANPQSPGETGQFTVRNHFAGAKFALEIVRFGPEGVSPNFHVALLSGDNYTYSVHGDADQGGEDLVLGTNGADEIYGGINNDILFGGAGADHFMFHDEGDSPGGDDVILDFNTATDRLDYTDIATLTMDGIGIGSSSFGNALISTVYGTVELIGVTEAEVTGSIFVLA